MSDGTLNRVFGTGEERTALIELQDWNTIKQKTKVCTDYSEIEDCINNLLYCDHVADVPVDLFDALFKKRWDINYKRTLRGKIYANHDCLWEEQMRNAADYEAQTGSVMVKEILRGVCCFYRFWTPLDVLRKVSIPVLKLILKEHITMYGYKYHQCSIADMGRLVYSLWENHLETTNWGIDGVTFTASARAEEQLLSIESLDDVNPEENDTQEDAVFKDLFERSKLLIMHCGHVCRSAPTYRPENEQYLLHLAAVSQQEAAMPLLHLAVYSQQPFFVTWMISKLYPNEIQRRDWYGGLPLHYVRVPMQLPLSFFSDAFYQKIEGIQTTSRSSPLVELLISKYPQGVNIADVYGQLPLTLYLGHNARFPAEQITKDIELLIAAGPKALRSRDPLSGFLPFMIPSAVRSELVLNEERCRSLITATYVTLRADPSELSHAVDPDKNIEDFFARELKKRNSTLRTELKSRNQKHEVHVANLTTRNQEQETYIADQANEIMRLKEENEKLRKAASSRDESAEKEEGEDNDATGDSSRQKKRLKVA